MAKKAQSSLLGQFKRKAKSTWTRSREKEAAPRGAQLPGGIIHGRAKLVEWRVDQTQDKGVPYLMIRGVVITPEEYRGASCNIMHFLQENEYNSMEDITDNISNDLQLLGCQTEDLDIDDFDEALDELCEEAPVFLYNTRKARNSDRVYISIQGLAEEEDEEDEEEVIEDDEPQEPEPEDEPEDEPEEDDDVPFEPKKGDIVYYKASPRGAYQEVEVRSVRRSNKTCTIKRLSDGKVFKDIRWEKLEEEEPED